MVQSQASTVDEYLAQASPEREPYLRQVRQLARKVLVGYEERMQWGMPVYVRRGKVRFGFAEQKQFITLYFMEPEILDDNAAALAGVVRGKSCLRFRRPERLDLRLVETLLRVVKRAAASPPASGREPKDVQRP